MGQETRNVRPQRPHNGPQRRTRRPRTDRPSTSRDHDHEQEREPPVPLEYDGEIVHIRVGVSARRVKQALGLPATDTVIIEYQGEAVALDDHVTVTDHAPAGAELRSLPLPDHQNVFG